MIFTLLLKIFLWIWSITPNESVVPLFVFFAMLESMLEIVGLCAYISTKRNRK